MFKKMTCVIALVLALVLSNSASGIIFWNADGFDDLWSNAANWDTDTIPISTEAVSIDNPDKTHCQITDGITAVCETLRVANSGSTTNLDISGGSLTASGAYIGVDNEAGHGILNMSGGLFSTGALQVGWGGTGTVNMTGGTIELTDDLVVPGQTGTGMVNLLGGTINADNLRMTSELGSMNITTGTLILDGNDIDTVQTYINDGWITSYKGQGTLNLDYNVTNEGKTTSKLNVTSIAVQTQSKTQYYWAVDTYVGSDADPVYGPIFSIYVDNITPRVDAGAAIATWLQDGTRTGNLDATVIDEEDCFLMWSVVSEPNEGTAVIEDIYAEDPNVTLSSVGEYVLKMLAFDGEYRGEDTVTINVYNDGCQAAQSLPDYEPIAGDLNGDCKVDDADMAMLEENWLKDISLIDAWYKID